MGEVYTEVKVEITRSLQGSSIGLTLEHKPIEALRLEIKDPPEIAEENGWLHWDSFKNKEYLPGDSVAQELNNSLHQRQWNDTMTLYYAQCGIVWDPSSQLYIVGTDGVMELKKDIPIPVYIYKNDLSMEYNLVTDRGTLDEIIRDVEITVEDTLAFNLSDTAVAPRYNVFEIETIEWQGPVYASDGTEISPKPDLILEDYKTLRIPEGTSVVGTIRIRYKTKRDETVLYVPPEEYTIPNPDFVSSEITGVAADAAITKLRWQAIVRAFYTGDFKEMLVDPTELAASCDWGMQVVFIDAAAPENSFGVEFRVLDYCTGEDITDTATVKVDGQTMSLDSANTLAKGSHNIVVEAEGYVSSDDDTLDNDIFLLE